MEDGNIIHNLLGTAYNVLLEQHHPDTDTFARLLNEHRKTLTMEGRLDHRSWDGDLRYWTLEGERLDPGFRIDIPDDTAGIEMVRVTLRDTGNYKWVEITDPILNGNIVTRRIGEGDFLYAVKPVDVIGG